MKPKSECKNLIYVSDEVFYGTVSLSECQEHFGFPVCGVQGSTIGGSDQQRESHRASGNATGGGGGKWDNYEKTGNLTVRENLELKRWQDQFNH